MLIPDNLIGIIIEEEGNTIWKIMSETETKINVSRQVKRAYIKYFMLLYMLCLSKIR